MRNLIPDGWQLNHRVLLAGRASNGVVWVNLDWPHNLGYLMYNVSYIHF